MEQIVKAARKGVLYLLLFINFTLPNPTKGAVTDSLAEVLKLAKGKAEKMYISVLIAGQLIPAKMDSAAVLLNLAAPLAEGTNLLYRAKYFNTNGVYYWYAGDLQKAIIFFKKTLELPSDNQIISQIAQASNNTGTLYRFLGNPDSARIYLGKALQIDEGRQNKPGILKTLYDLGALHRQTSQYELALRFALKAVEIVPRETDASMTARVYTLMGNVYAELDSIDQAIASHKQALKYANIAGDSAQVCASFANLNAIYSELPSEFDQANEYYEKGIKIATKLSNFELLVSLNDNKGKAFMLRGNYERAMPYFKMAIKYLAKVSSPRLEPGLYYNIGKAFKGLKNLDSALVYLKKSHACAVNIESLLYQSESLFEIAKIYEMHGNTSQAFENYKVASSLHDSIWNLRNLSKISEMQIIYQTNEKEHLIDKLQSKDRFNQLLRTSIILISVAVILVLVFFMLYARKRRLVAEQSIIIRQNEHEKTMAQLAANRKELTAKVHAIVTFEEFLADLEANIRKMTESADNQSEMFLNSVLTLLGKKGKSHESWNELMKRFDEMNDKYIIRLSQKYPHLSPIEIRICAMIKLNMSTKEIADLTKRSVRTIESYRTDIRKKIGLENSENLAYFLSNQ